MVPCTQEYCRRSFPDEEALATHVHNFHKVKLPKPYSCPGCSHLGKKGARYHVPEKALE